MNNDVFVRLDNEFNDLRRRVDRAAKWGTDRSQAEALRNDCLRFLSRAHQAGYFALCLRAINDFIANPYSPNRTAGGGPLRGHSSQIATIEADIRRQRGRSALVPPKDSKTPEATPSPAAHTNPDEHSYTERSKPQPTNTPRRSPGNNQPGQARVARKPPSTRQPDPQTTATAEPASTLSAPKSKSNHDDHGAPTTRVPSTTPAPARQQAPTPAKPPSPAHVGRFMGRQLKAIESSPGPVARAEVPRAQRRSGAVYRTYLTARPGTSFTDMLKVVQEWLNSKHIVISVRQNERSVHADGQFVAETERASDGQDLFRLRLIEKSREQLATYTTDLVVSGGHQPWVWIDIRNDKDHYVAVPRVARDLLSQFPLYDGSWRMQSDAVLIDREGIDVLIGALKDGRRRVPLVLAGSEPHADMEELFQGAMDEWGQQVYGLGGVALLDPEATRAFNTAVGPAFRVGAWSLRTYLPDLDLDEPSTAHRHRYLGTQRLVEDRPGRVATLMGNVARSVAATTPVPAIVLEALHQLDHESNRRLLESIRTPRRTLRLIPSTTIPESPSAPAESLEANELRRLRQRMAQVQEWLELPSLEDEHLFEVVEALELKRNLGPAAEQIATRLSALEDENRDLRVDVADYVKITEEAEKDAADSGAREYKLREQVLYLQSQLAKHENAETVYGEFHVTEEAQVPENMEDLVDRLDELESQGVFFTGETRIVEGLAPIDHAGGVVRSAWECLLACAGYLQAKKDQAFSGSMDEYLRKQTPGYRVVPVLKHARGESETTRNKYRRERVFPVPPEVRTDGQAFMEAHFKLGQIGMVSRRMHYIDDSQGTGRIYVGYIGPHLRTDGTN